MGVDPGSLVTGYGVVEGAGAALSVVAFGGIRCPGTFLLSERLLKIHRGISALLREHRPDAVAVEGIFHSRNVRSAFLLGASRGVVLLAAAEAGAPVIEYAPRRVKLAVVGTGTAHKSQVQRMVRVRLGLQEVPRPADAADALAIALCHLQAVGGGVEEPKRV